MRALLFIAVAYLLLLAWGVATELVAMPRGAPDLALLVPLYLGLSAADRSLPRALATSFVIGYLADVLGGAPHGLYATSAVLSCLLGDALAARFFVRGVVIGAAAGFLASLVGGVVAVTVQLETLRVHRLTDTLLLALVQAGLTAVCAPPCLALFRRVDARHDRFRAARRAVPPLPPRRSGVALP